MRCFGICNIGYILWNETNCKQKDRKRTDRGGLTVILLFTFAGLFVFKYLNFINEVIWGVLMSIGCRMEVPHLDLLLPVGISFYTFQACGYAIDVYREI